MDKLDDVYYRSDDGSRRVLTQFGNLYSKAVNHNGSYNASYTSEARYFPPLWLRSPEKNSTSVLGVFFQQHTGNPFFRVCTVSSFWRTTQTTLSIAERGRLVQIDQVEARDVRARDSWAPISIDLNNIRSFNTGEFHHSLAKSTVGDNEVTLAIIFAAALATVSEPSRDYWYVFAGQSEIDAGTATAVDITTTIYGYGYGTTSTSVLLSIAVITTYCIITITYIAYILITGSTSTAWNSGIELVALALQSKRPSHLGHTSTGIDAMHTFRESVGIRVNTDDELELVFANDRDTGTRQLRKIERNKAY